MSNLQYFPLSKLIDGLQAGVSVRSTTEEGFGPRILKTSAVKSGHFISSESKPVLATDKSRLRNPIKSDSLLISRMNTPALVGDVAYVEQGDEQIFLPDRLWSARSSSIQKTNIQWLAYYLASDEGASRIKGLASGTSGSMKNISKAKILSLVIPTPSYEVQTEISNSLSEVDQLASNIELQIAKKRDVKQGVMQQLLTGRTRLPGSEGDWIHVTWGEVARIIKSGSTPRRSEGRFWNGTIPWVTSTELKRGIIKSIPQTITEAGRASANLTVWPAGTFLMAITGLEAAGTRGSCGLLSTPAATNQSCMAVIPNDRLDPDYLFYFYLLNGENLAFEYTQGTKQMSYNAKIVRSLPIQFPEDINEQRAIAGVLKQCDEELSLLEQKLAKVKDIKQGMMQQLLTGRVRLPLDQEVKA